MTPTDIICLAYSRKHNGRCIAGLRLDGGGWVRPVADTRDGALQPCHFRMEDGREPRVLDVLRIPLALRRPAPHQPENWIVGPGSWAVLDRSAGDSALHVMHDFLQVGPALFGDVRDRFECDFLRRKPVAASLALVAPRSISWEIRTTRKGNRQTRAKFLTGQVFYNLSITDPDWERRLGHLPPGFYSNADAGVCPDEKLLLTISIGEPFEQQCYKIVAAVIVMPR